MGSSTLELPQFKGIPGWEFTDISKLDLDAFEPGDPADARPAIFDMPANAAPLDGHDLLGTVVTKEDAFTVRNREQLVARRARARARGRRGSRSRS